MKTVIGHSCGINWTHFAEIQINGDVACIVKSWRLHNFKPEQGSENHPVDSVPYEDLSRSVDIYQWTEDGRPGGTEGLRANYRRPPRVKVGGTIYRLEPDLDRHNPYAYIQGEA